MKQIELELDGLDCASCAGKIEKLTNDVNGVDTATLDFITKKLKINLNKEDQLNRIIDEIKGIVKRLEPHVVVIDKTISNKKYYDYSDHSHDDHNHHHEHDHHHHHGEMNKKEVGKIIISSILFIIPFMLKLQGTSRFMIYLLSYLVIGGEIVIRAAKNLAHGDPFDENFLMTLATIGAFAIGEYPEGVAVMLFYQVGEMFQGMAVNHSRKSISSLLDIRPDYANIEKNGEIVVVDPKDVHVGDYIIVKPGEKIPLDGVIVEGESSLDTSNITGESVPRNVRIGDNILSGVVNIQGLLKIKVEKEFGESTVSKILNLVENASSKKAETEKFITKFARYYTPAVVFISLIIGVLPTILFSHDFKESIYRAFVFLVISCPCALVISIPLGFFGGIGGASKRGILVKGGNYLEALNGVDTIVFDKTGTLTKGTFKVTQIENYGDFEKEEVLKLAAFAEVYSNHPIGKSIIKAYGKEIDKDILIDYKEISGKGIEVNIQDEKVLVGNKKLFIDNNIEIREIEAIGTIVYVGKNNVHIGTIVVSDELKENVISHIKMIKQLGIKETIMLSGDNCTTVNKVGELVQLDKVYGDLLPQDKLSILEDIIKNKNGKGKVAYVGDGVNDAPVLARADVGIAMGGVGSDAAIEASDIVIMTDEISKIATGIKIARNTNKIVIQNIILALGLKIVVLIFGAMGMASMWQAVFADVGVSILAILNSIRALKVEE